MTQGTTQGGTQWTSAAAEESHGAKPYRVLVADDTVANRTLVKAYLGRLGFGVVLAENGKEAVEIFEREPLDIILMDVMMPVMDGLEATREIRSRVPERWIPIVMLSALGSDADVVSGLDTGADDYLIKPLSYQIFAAKMRTVSRALSLQRETERALAKVRAISEGMSDGLLSFDGSGRILAANPALARLLERNAESFVGESVFTLFGSRGADALRADLMRRESGEDGGEEDRGHGAHELEVEGPCGPLLFEAVVSRLHDEEDAQAYMAVLRDVSARKRAEQELAAKNTALQRYHDEAERENELAQQILERQVRRSGLADPSLRFHILPAERFSGDLILAERAPDGRLFCMLADATGHGLSAAVSVLPAVTEFYRMVAQSPALGELVVALSGTLHASMPVGRFVAAALVCVDNRTGLAEAWVGGLPRILQLDAQGAVKASVTSHDLPLGIEPLRAADVACRTLNLAAGEALLLFSDGLLEAPSPAGEALGYPRLEAALRGVPPEARLAAIERAVAEHCKGRTQHDDLSVLLVSA
ncbi:SpoIIE family protein phosphatase [Niveibacterium sp. SC-1]|uniref:SpoIIE family protein phosphatase n=1 Tax=Niveibacterium sp. SC-1 TaxID=3135646 RepID=UPI00311D784E